jgi:diguanylate cyclase (GGDEF)-like protein/PAS domain S-box-containing protein
LPVWNVPPGVDHRSIDAMTAAAGLTGLSPDTGVAVQSADGELVAASSQAQRILGLSFDQMRGRTSQDPRWAAVDEFGRPMSGDQHPAMRALRAGVPVRRSIMGVHRPGSDAPGRHVWIEVTAVPLASTDGTAPWVVVAFRPVRGERLRALELADSERIFRMIAEHSSDLVAWQLLADSTFLWASPASRAVLGMKPDELIGVRDTDLVHPEDLATVEQWRRSMIDSGVSPGPLTVRMRYADGAYRWIETTADVVTGAGGTAPQMITTRRDVTDRVVAERARDSAVRLFEAAMEHSTVALAVRAVDGPLVRVNPALCRFLGRSADELVGHHLHQFAVDPVRGPALLAVEAGRCTHYESEQQFRRSDGTTVWCLRTIVALPDASGRFTHVMEQMQDITARKELAAQLEKAALTDSLTGLPNRTVLEARLTRALASARRTGTDVGVLFIDLDDFKKVNDTFGHDAGDALLREVGIRLMRIARHTDTAVRLGGDEFVIIHENLAGDGELDDVADGIRAVLAEPFCIGGHDIRIVASVGTARGARVTARELLSRADQDMYRSKRSGDGRVRAPTRSLLGPSHSEVDRPDVAWCPHQGSNLGPAD